MTKEDGDFREKVSKKKYFILGGTLILTLLIFLALPLIFALIIFTFILLPVLIYTIIYLWIKRPYASLLFSASIWVNINLILLPVLGGLFISDLTQFQADLITKDKIMVLEQNKKFIAGFEFADFNQLENLEDISFFKSFTSDQLKKLDLKDDTKIFFILKEGFFDKESPLELKQAGIQITLDKNKVFDVINSDQAFNDLVLLLGKSIPLEENFIKQDLKSFGIENNADARNVMTLLLIKDVLDKKGVFYLFEAYKEGTLEIKPNYWSLKAIKILLPEKIAKSYNQLPFEFIDQTTSKV